MHWNKCLNFQVLKLNTLMNFEKIWCSKGRMGMGFNAPSAEKLWLRSRLQKPMFSECTSLLNITNVIYVMRQSNINSISENILVKNTSKEARIWSKTMLHLYQGQIINLKLKENQNKFANASSVPNTVFPELIFNILPWIIFPSGKVPPLFTKEGQTRYIKFWNLRIASPSKDVTARHPMFC